MGRKILNIILKFSLFIFLTVLTQIGGVVFLISLFVSKKIKIQFKFKFLATFLSLYLVFTFFITPILAPLFGREKVIHSKKIKPSNYITILLNRNYVKPELNILLVKVSEDLKETDIQISYLDANFPFINKFPLLPHLSHNDGKKIDVSLIYEDTQGKISTNQKSLSGYGVFVEPTLSEHNQTELCKNGGYFQYDYPKYLTFGKVNDDLVFSEKGTKKLINSLLRSNNLGKIFIEPHLKNRLGLIDQRIRFQGCRAVRHDDHIHLQLK